MRCCGSEKLNSLGVPKEFNGHSGGYARFKLLEIIVLKDKASIELIVDDELQLLPFDAGNTFAS